MFSRLSFSDHSIFSDLQRLEQELDDLTSAGTAWAGGIRSLPPGTFPAVNVGSSDDQVTVYVFAPGVDPKKLDIQLQQNLLSVSGRRDLDSEDRATYYRRERFNGEFRRVLSLPDDVDPDKIDAVYRDGIVQISLRRRESTKPRQIEVR